MTGAIFFFSLGPEPVSCPFPVQRLLNRAVFCFTQNKEISANVKTPRLVKRFNLILHVLLSTITNTTIYPLSAISTKNTDNTTFTIFPRLGEFFSRQYTKQSFRNALYSVALWARTTNTD